MTILVPVKKLKVFKMKSSVISGVLEKEVMGFLFMCVQLPGSVADKIAPNSMQSVRKKSPSAARPDSTISLVKPKTQALGLSTDRQKDTL